MIEVENLIYEYPGVRALDGVGFSIERGSIAALVGPNGAGKTTLLRCLAGLDRPLSGTIHIDRIDVIAQPRECHRRIGYLSDFFGLYEDLTVAQALTYVAAANRVPEGDIADATARVAARLAVTEHLRRRGRELSRGQRQRVAIAQAVIHAPGVLLLDEPASGLDPEARHTLARLFTQLRDEGMTLMVSSHILAELEEYSTCMLILRQGRLIEQSSLHRAADGGTPLRLLLAAPVSDAAQRLLGVPGVLQVTAVGESISVLFDGDAQARHRLLKAAIEAGLPVCGLTEERRNLQESYLARVSEHGQS